MMTFPKHLLEGYKAFATQRLPTEQTRYRELSVKGQSPEVMVIGCCDSRVSPEVIFDVGPGELFVVRNIANLVPVYQPDGTAHGVSAALEYAVTVLKVKHIVVLGHAQCGGIRAFVDKIEPLTPGDFIGKWMQMFIKPGEVVEQREHESMAQFVERIEKAAVFRSLENLMTFPFVRKAVESGQMQTHGAYFGRLGGLAVRAGQGDEGIQERTERGVGDRSRRVGKAKRAHHLSQSERMVGTAREERAFAHPTASRNYAACFFALISLRLISTSAIWIALSAAPLRKLSDTHQSTRPFSTVASSRMRLM
ncbi:carbonic anhydrase [Bradyrhizobium liaoningense]